MKKNCTELVFILDRSGSMQGLEKDTIGGFNAMLEKQRNGEGEVLVTTYLFDHNVDRIHDRLSIQEVLPMTEKEYSVGGCTALLDAVGMAIRHIAAIHHYARPEDVPAHTIFVITTDGMENASKHYSKAEVKRMVEHEKEKYGWEFIFLGANIDAVETAAGFGIGADRAASFHNDAEGIRTNYEAVSETLSAVRVSKPVPTSWSRRIKEDFKSRKQ